MMTNNFASQSTEARNSANITLNAWSMSETAWKSMEINDETFNEFKLSVDSLYMFLVRAISDSKINSCIWFTACGKEYCFTFAKNDDGYIVLRETMSGSDHEYYMGDRKRFTFGNISDFADRLCYILADYYYSICEAEAANNAAEISEAPVLEETPSLDEAPMLEEDDITDEGYFIKGLAYVRESLEDVDVVSMVKESMGVLFNDPYTMESIMCGGVLDQEKFADALWNIVWEEHLCGLTDEALEAETRYYTDFDALCLQMCDFGDVVNRVVDVIKEYYNNYLPSYLDQFGECVITVYWNRFSEADMMMLIENEEVALAVRDVLLSDNIILDKDGFLVYDDGVYLTVDYNKIANKVAA